MTFSLSVGAIKSMLAQDDAPVSVDPTLQVLSIKQVANERWRLVLSDGETFAAGMLPSTQTYLVTGDSPQIGKNSVIRLNKYCVNNVSNRQIVIMLELEILGQTEEKIGEPVQASIESAQASAAPAAPAPAAPQAAAGRGGSNASSTSAAKSGKAAQAARGGLGQKTGAPIYPIEGLSPYQNKWTIKARVTSKSDVRHWSNAKGDGKLFSVNLLDDTGEIKATGFNDAVDRLEPIFEEGKVYYISKARVNIAKKQFSNLSNEYEIMFGNDTEVQLCEDQDAAPQIKYNFVQLAALHDVEKDSIVDVLGIVKENGEVSEITAKATSKKISKRELTVCDQSGYQIRVTLWGRTATDWKETDHGLFAFKGAKVGDFQGRNLSMGGQSTIQADPDVAEAHELRGWYDTEGKDRAFNTMQGSEGGAASASSFKKDEFKLLDEVVTNQIGMSDQFSYYSTRATITHLKFDNLWYPACPADRCNKKVNVEENGMWRCEKCSTTYPAPEYRYIMSFVASDFTNQVWLSGFNDVGLQIFGKSANELEAIKSEDEGSYLAIAKTALGQSFNFNIRAKADSYQGEERVRHQIQRAAPVNYVQAAKDMLETLDQWDP